MYNRPVDAMEMDVLEFKFNQIEPEFPFKYFV